jgi:hypothetical protein
VKFQFLVEVVVSVNIAIVRVRGLFQFAWAIAVFLRAAVLFVLMLFGPQLAALLTAFANGFWRNRDPSRNTPGSLYSCPALMVSQHHLRLLPG